MCKDETVPERNFVSEVLPNLFVGGVEPARERSILIEKFGITHVVNATQRETNHFEDVIHYYNAPVLDVPSAAPALKDHLKPTADFIEDALTSGGRVYVHCVAGISRSPTLVMAYLMIYGKKTLAEALDCVTQSRKIASPNSTFFQTLIDLEQETQGVETVDIECYKAAIRTKLECTQDTLCDLIANLKAKQGPDSQIVVISGHCMIATRLLDDPRVARIDNFVSDEEADYLIELANNTGLKQSHVVGSKGSNGGPAGRKSTSCRVERNNPIVAKIVDRASRLVNMTPYHTEPIQVIRYGVGEHYNLHHDWFNPAHPGYEERVKDRGQRLVSMFVYLAQSEEGGCTYFPNINFRFEPMKGTAVLWYNRDKNGNMDERLLHAGEPVIKGEKYGMNIWFREHPRPRPSGAQSDRIGY